MIRFCLMLWLALGVFCEVAAAESRPLNQMPMYGGLAKDATLSAADAAFIAGIEKQYSSRQEGAKQVVKIAWTYWAKRDLVRAMVRFNQAWLLDPENGNIYHGFAVISSMRQDAPGEVRRLFQLAISKPTFDPEVLVDYGRFLWSQQELDKSMEQLQRALQLSPTARDARSHIAFVYYLKGDFANACSWARDARKQGEELEKGFLEDMCSR